MALLTAVGGRESNSYIQAAEADAILTAFSEASGIPITDWTSLSQQQKEYRLLMAVAIMAYFPWRGRRIYCGQALQFPRDLEETRIVTNPSFDMELTGQTRISFFVPDIVKEAQAQIAYNVVHKALVARPTLEAENLPANARVTQVALSGILTVQVSGDPAKKGSILDLVCQSLQWPTYFALMKFTSQIRGGTIEGMSPQWHYRQEWWRRMSMGYLSYWGYSSNGVYRGGYPSFWPWERDPCLTTTTTTTVSTSSTSSTPAPSTTTSVTEPGTTTTT
jgi:hypothetical protein